MRLAHRLSAQLAQRERQQRLAARPRPLARRRGAAGGGGGGRWGVEVEVVVEDVRGELEEGARAPRLVGDAALDVEERVSRLERGALEHLGTREPLDRLAQRGGLGEAADARGGEVHPEEADDRLLQRAAQLPAGHHKRLHLRQQAEARELVRRRRAVSEQRAEQRLPKRRVHHLQRGGPRVGAALRHVGDKVEQLAERAVRAVARAGPLDGHVAVPVADEAREQLGVQSEERRVRPHHLGVGAAADAVAARLARQPREAEAEDLGQLDLRVEAAEDRRALDEQPEQLDVVLVRRVALLRLEPHRRRRRVGGVVERAERVLEEEVGGGLAALADGERLDARRLERAARERRQPLDVRLLALELLDHEEAAAAQHRRPARRAVVAASRHDRDGARARPRKPARQLVEGVLRLPLVALLDVEVRLHRVAVRLEARHHLRLAHRPAAVVVDRVGRALLLLRLRHDRDGADGRRRRRHGRRGCWSSRTLEERRGRPRRRRCWPRRRCWTWRRWFVAPVV